MSKVKAVLDFYKNTLPKKAVELADLCEEIGLLTFSGEYAGKVVRSAGLTAVYADHVTAELQAENAGLRAKVVGLEKGREWLPIESAPRDGTRILLLCPMVGVACGAWSDEKFAAKPRPYFITDRERAIGITATRNDQPSHFMYLPQGITK